MTAYIAGVGETAPTKVSGLPLSDLIGGACAEALLDSKLTPCDIDGVVLEGHSMAHSFPVEACQDLLGLNNLAVNRYVSRSGAGVVGALTEAAKLIDEGAATTVLTYFGVDFGTRRRTGQGLGPADGRSNDPEIDTFERPYGYWPQVLWFAGMATRYLHLHHLDEGDVKWWSIANRVNAGTHPSALERTPLDADAYDAQPYIATPLKRSDCSLINDGAAAAVITTSRHLRKGGSKPIAILGGGFARSPLAGRSSMVLRDEIVETAAAQSSEAALQQAGLSTTDIDFAEIYDCFSIAAIVQAEEMGLLPPGQALPAARDGATLTTGSIPINTHGGLTSNSYTLGVGHVIEAVAQLRGQRGPGQVQRARVGLVAGFGGWEHATAILGVDS